MRRKNIAIIIAVVSVMGILAGCKKDETVLPGETPIETPVNEPVETSQDNETPEAVEKVPVEIIFSEDVKLISFDFDKESNKLTYGIKNNTMFDLNYGAAYDIMKKLEDGTFVSTGYMDEMAFDMALRVMQKDGNSVDTIDFTLFSEAFEDGDYYIVRQYDNGDGTELGKHIPEVLITIENGKVKYVEGEKLEYDVIINSVNKYVQYTTAEAINSSISFSMDARFYKSDIDMDADHGLVSDEELLKNASFTEVDLGFEKTGLFATADLGEPYIGEFSFEGLTFTEKGIYEARILYSFENGASNEIVIPFKIMGTVLDREALNIYGMGANW